MVLTTNRGEQADQGPAREATPTRLTIAADELHVWRASLERPAPVVAGLRRRLALDERQRADRFRFERDRSRYIVGRGLLRTLLGRYLALNPEMIRFEYGAFEKPELRDPGLWFNLSHSGPVALYAITQIGAVGIDVELEDEDFSRDRIAERFFSPAETAVLRSLPQRLQARAFLTCWTRKEAFIKARGDGLSLALDSFDVAFAPGAPAAVIRTAWSQDEPQRWSLQDLSDRRASYVAAVAVRGQVRRIVNRELI